MIHNKMWPITVDRFKDVVSNNIISKSSILMNFLLLLKVKCEKTSTPNREMFTFLDSGSINISTIN
jgi:hypothetical protein